MYAKKLGLPADSIITKSPTCARELELSLETKTKNKYQFQLAYISSINIENILNCLPCAWNTYRWRSARLNKSMVEILTSN